MTLLEKKVLIGFGQTGGHKTPRTSWVSTCGKILKGNKYKGIGDFNFWPVRLGFFGGKFLLELEWWYKVQWFKAVLGQAVLGQAVLGQAVLGQAVLGQAVFGQYQKVLGQYQKVLG